MTLIINDQILIISLSINIIILGFEGIYEWVIAYGFPSDVWWKQTPFSIIKLFACVTAVASLLLGYIFEEPFWGILLQLTFFIHFSSYSKANFSIFLPTYDDFDSINRIDHSFSRWNYEHFFDDEFCLNLRYIFWVV